MNSSEAAKPSSGCDDTSERLNEAGQCTHHYGDQSDARALQEACSSSWRGAETATARHGAHVLGGDAEQPWRRSRHPGQRRSNPARLNRAVNAYRRRIAGAHARESTALVGCDTRTIWSTRSGSLGQREPGTARSTRPGRLSRGAAERTREKYRLPGQPRRTTSVPRCASWRARRRHGAAQRGSETPIARRCGTHARESAAVLGRDAEQPGRCARTPGERQSDVARLDEAVTAYREALQERTREKVPLDWATTQNNLGIALRLGRNASQVRRGSRRAVTAFRERCRSARARGYPSMAATQNNLAPR